MRKKVYERFTFGLRKQRSPTPGRCGRHVPSTFDPVPLREGGGDEESSAKPPVRLLLSRLGLLVAGGWEGGEKAC